MRTKNTVRFLLKAYQGSEYDLWFPYKDGKRTESSEIRPQLDEFKRYWPDHAIDESKTIALCEQKARELKFTLEGPWIVADMDSQNFEALVAWLTELTTLRLLYPERGYLTVKLIDTPEAPYSWFELRPNQKITHVNDRTGDVRNNLTGNARRAKPEMHIGDALLGPYVSETVKELIESKGFAGVDFVWVEDKGLYQAPQWFWLTPQRCIGRGVDHPFFDIRKRTRYPVENSAEWRYGVTRFYREELRRAAPFESSVWNQFVSLFIEAGHDGLQFDTYRQYLRDCLPDTDFAFGREIRPAFLCFNRKVRDALLAEHLVHESECRPILILDKAPIGVDVPDALGESQHSYFLSFDRGQLAELQREKAAAYQRYLRNPTERVPANLEKSLELLAAARKRDPVWFSAGAEERTLDEVARRLSVSFPRAWREVLKVSNGFRIDAFDAFDIVPAESLPAHQIPLFLPQVDGASTRYLKITDGYSGDYHCLDLSTLNQAGDCQVNEFDHEGPNEPVRYWSSIAEFIEESLVIQSAEEADE